MERTLLIVKPDATERNLIGQILQRVELAHFGIVDMRLVWLNSEKARMFYAVHEGKPFFDGLVEFMSSGPAVAVVLEKENAITDLRALVGTTDPAEAPCGTIRHDFGHDVQRNSVHASDAVESAAIEIEFFFPRSKHGSDSR
jgi:nucleoside-diphosphate kinase